MGLFLFHFNFSHFVPQLSINFPNSTSTLWIRLSKEIGAEEEEEQPGEVGGGTGEVVGE